MNMGYDSYSVKAVKVTVAMTPDSANQSDGGVFVVEASGSTSVFSNMVELEEVGNTHYSIVIAKKWLPNLVSTAALSNATNDLYCRRYIPGLHRLASRFAYAANSPDADYFNWQDQTLINVDPIADNNVYLSLLSYPPTPATSAQGFNYKIRIVYYAEMSYNAIPPLSS